MTICIISSDLRKIGLAPDLPERDYCVSRRVSVGEMLSESQLGNVKRRKYLRCLVYSNP